MITKAGNEIDNTCAVFIEWEMDERGFSLLFPVIAEDGNGDRAVVIETRICKQDKNCHVLNVWAPNGKGQFRMEDVHVDDTTQHVIELIPAVVIN